MLIPAEEKSFQALFNHFIQPGEVVWMGVRVKSKQPMTILEEVNVEIGGLEKDRYNIGRPDGSRAVTLIQYEHLQAVASFLNREFIDPALLRRNIVVKGINLSSLKGKKIIIGEAILEMTGYCHPCSRMEEALGLGGYNAMRGHGGITCKVVKPGKMMLKDRVIAEN